MRTLATAALALALLAPQFARADDAPSTPDAPGRSTQFGQSPSEQAPLYSLEGTISAVTGGRLWLQDDAGDFHRLALPEGVKALEGGRPVDVDELPEGTPVRTTARVVNGDEVVERIEVQPTPNAPTPGANPSGARR